MLLMIFIVQGLEGGTRCLMQAISVILVRRSTFVQQRCSSVLWLEGPQSITYQHTWSQIPMQQCTFVVPIKQLIQSYPRYKISNIDKPNIPINLDVNLV